MWCAGSNPVPSFYLTLMELETLMQSYSVDVSGSFFLQLTNF